ncbi:AGE family epimerase/isomerase [Bartonella tamiae]|uniref:Mannose-1-phosphate guanylyltransferase/mannose-6-phosphate isomerase n=1 Tax=Bartonella tamiae Th239 TaxID=1094558 RepID=J1JZ64_9HYPH|nr:AGE family epimerase/isomerase [Bartonella tamiae]EJF90392.1 mannose-1-phosphate guanylyltransferase/mannose-6-phosphate isomerase [Bartonella tamiae Th239]EJF93664.1 mannose-1-phosphate guanylyltransferase/mannose-6-phosphate isomerase [Bartonella tamiae Th307]
MAKKIISFIMSGGIGSRLWPLSREDFPKQFHDLSGKGSMVSRTIKRLNARKSRNDPIYLIASENHEYRLREDIAGLDLHGGSPIFEPIGRNTAAAVALATHITLKNYGDESLMLIVPSDHEITTHDAFWESIEEGIKAAQNGHIVLFGIRPNKPETGYGYIEIGAQNNNFFEVLRFVEKPNEKTAIDYLKSPHFFWNSGIFLFSAATMKKAFQTYQNDIWDQTENALKTSHTDISGTWLNFDAYSHVPSDSIDYAIMENVHDIALVPARFQWNDLGSWQSLLDHHSSPTPLDENGNVIIGDVVAINCKGSYLRSQSGLLSTVGLDHMAVVATHDATFVAPVNQSQNVRDIVSALEKAGRLETKFTPAIDKMPQSGAYIPRVEHWLFEETLPLWSTRGVDEMGGFHEALSFDGLPILREKRMRTMARQIYAFAMAGQMGWDGPYQDLIDHGIHFISRHGQLENGGFASHLSRNGEVINATQESYDQSCVLLALAHAHHIGHAKALPLAMEIFSFLDHFLTVKGTQGFLENTKTEKTKIYRRSNPHMHLLECFLAWYDVTGNTDYLQRATHIVNLFKSHFFDEDTWTLGEYFDNDWQRLDNADGDLCEPGHHFEWSSLLIDYSNKKHDPHSVKLAKKLYASTIANGLNRATGLAYNTISRHGMPVDTHSRSWPQTEAIKAAIALDGNQGPDLKPEIEARVGRLFRWHIEAAPKGLWIDKISENGRSIAKDVPASIFYHMITALTQYREFIKKTSQ